MKIETDLGISPRIYAVLGLLGEYEISVPPKVYPDVRTFAWYNGREKGFTLTITMDYKTSLVIFCYIHRNSDSQIVVAYGEYDYVPFNSPTIESGEWFVEAVYQN